VTDDGDAGEDRRDGPSDVPHDVRAALTQLLDRAGRAAEAGDIETAASLLDTAETVAENKLPDGDLAAAYADAAAARVSPE
jgi:hypothetical protein